MTTIFFIRHAQPDESCRDDSARPLTALGASDVPRVAEALAPFPVDAVYSSPYRRAYDTVAPMAAGRGLEIITDYRLREREQGENSRLHLEARWADFTCAEPGGEGIGSVQRRNVEAILEILSSHPGQTVAVGTHGTALSAILNHFDPSIGLEWFRDIWHAMPYILKADFDGVRLVKITEILRIDRGY